MKPSCYYLLALSFLGCIQWSVGQSLSDTHETPAINNPEIQNKITAYQTQNSTAIGAQIDVVDAVHFGGSSADWANAVVSDADGNYYICGSFSGEIKPDVSTITSVGKRDGFVAKYNSSGELQWWTNLEASADQTVDLRDIALSPTGNIVVTGFYTGNLNLGVGNVLWEDHTNSRSTFIAELDTNGDIATNTYLMALSSRSDGGLNPWYEAKVVVDQNYKYALVSVDEDESHIFRIDSPNKTKELLSESQINGRVESLVLYESNLYIAVTIESEEDFSKIVANEYLIEPSTVRTAVVCKMNFEGQVEWVSGVNHKFDETDRSGYSKAIDFVINSNNQLVLVAWLIDFGKVGDLVVNLSGYIYCVFNTNGNGINYKYAILSNGLSHFPGEYSFWSGSGGTFYSIDKGNVHFYNSDFDLVHTYEFEEFDVRGLSDLESNALLCIGQEHNSITISRYSATHEFIDKSIVESNSLSSEVISIEHDKNNNVYIYGYATANLKVFGSEINRGYFLAKLNPGNELIWIRNLNTNYTGFGAMSFYGDAMALDQSNSEIVVFATFSESLSIPGEEQLHSEEDINTAIVKFDFDGSLVDHWILSSEEKIYDLALDSEGKILVSGTFSNGTDIGGVTVLSKGARDSFIAKFDRTGAFEFLNVLGGSGIEYLTLSDADQQGDTYFVSETTSDQIFLNDVMIEVPEYQGQNTLIGKLDSDGKYLWSKLIGSDRDEDKREDAYTYPTGLKIDDGGFIYLKGNLGGLAFFDEIKIEIPDQSNEWGSNHFISKLTSGGEIIWIESIEQTDGFGWGGNEFDVDLNGNVYFALEAQSPVVFGNSYKFEPNQEEFIYLMKYTSDGRFNWFKPIEGTGRSIINSLSINSSDKIAIGGQIRGERLYLDEFEINGHELATMFFANLEVVNQLPLFITTPVLLVDEGVEYIYDIQVEDKDEFSVVTIDSEELPDWLSFSDLGEGKAIMSGVVPSDDEVSEWNVVISATDGIIEDPVLQTFKLTLRTQSQILSAEDKLAEKKSVTLFPNPVKNMMTIELDEKISKLSLSIFDVAGHIIESWDRIERGQGPLRLDLSHLKPGLYMMTGKASNTYWNKTFIKE